MMTTAVPAAPLLVWPWLRRILAGFPGRSNIEPSDLTGNVPLAVVASQPTVAVMKDSSKSASMNKSPRAIYSANLCAMIISREQNDAT